MADWTLHHGDYRDVLDDLPDAAAVITDPPYGVRNNCNHKRFSQARDSPYFDGTPPPAKSYPPVVGDDERPDLSPFLRFKYQAIWGAHYSPTDTGIGTVLVWQKRSDRSLGCFNSDAELCWINRGRGVYIYKHLWNGCCRASEGRDYHHPTQKPAAVTAELIRRLKLPEGTLIFDPFAGAGGTGVAARQLGHPYLGCEIVKEYADIARTRIGDVV